MKHFLGEWAHKQKAGEISKAEEPKVYHHGQVYGTKDLKGDKALVGKYKTKEGEMKHPPKGKDEKREMASDLIREHMHHLGRHSGGPKQAIAIALRQAGLNRKKSIGKANPEPVAVPVTSTYKPTTQAHPDVQVAHQHVQDAMGKLQALHEHLSGMAQKWKAEDEETGQKRAGLLRRSLDVLVEKGHRAFYSSKGDPHRHGGADTPKDAQAAEGGKGHSGFYRRKATKGDRAMMGKGIDVLAEEGRSVARAARKSMETCKGCGKAMGLCKCAMKSKTAQATDILKGRMKLVTDESGKMRPVSTERTPTMSLEKIESGPSAGQHKMIGPSHYEGGSTGPGRMQTSGGEHTQVIASSPRMHTLTPAGTKPEPSMATRTAVDELKQMGPPKTGQFGSTPKLAAPVKPKTELEGALGEIKQMGAPKKEAMAASKALTSLLNKAPTEMSSNPTHGEPALNPRSEKPEMHHALGAAFHERRRDSSPVGSGEWERHDMLAGGHAKKLAGVVGSPKAARAAIKQAHGTLTGQGASAIKDRHVSPGGGGTQSLPESLLHEREPAWAGPKQSASSVRGKLMASVSGQMDKALEALLSKGGTSCPDCGKALSKPGLKRCPHCDTELPQKAGSSNLNPRWGFRAAGVEKAGTERTKMKIDDVQERIVAKGAAPTSDPSPKPKTATPLRIGPPKMGPAPQQTFTTTQQQGKMSTPPMEKAMSARSVPRMPRALAMQMDSWRNATNVMTRGNSRFSDGINTAVLLPDPTEAVSTAMVDSNPVVCKGCGRSYMHKSFPAGCPTCTSRKEVPGAWDFVSKAK